MNVWVVAGNLGRAAEVKTLASGVTVVSFALALSEHIKGEKVTTWVDCSWFGDRAPKVAPYLTQGAKITVTGRAGHRVWSKDGESKGTLTMMVNDVTLQGDRGGTADAAPRAAAPASRPAATPSARPPAAPSDGAFSNDDDIPF